jgi:hypothetical protein
MTQRPSRNPTSDSWSRSSARRPFEWDRSKYELFDGTADLAEAVAIRDAVKRARQLEAEGREADARQLLDASVGQRVPPPPRASSARVPLLINLPALLARSGRPVGTPEEQRVFVDTAAEFTPYVAAATATSVALVAVALRSWRWKSRSLVSLSAGFAAHWAALLAQESVTRDRLYALPDPPPPPPPPAVPKRSRWWA